MSVQKNYRRRRECENIISNKQTIWKAVGRVLLLAFLLWFVFHKHYREIYENICRASIGTIILISCMGISYQIIWGMALYVLMRKKNPQITIKNAIENVYLGFFASIVAFTLGELPMKVFHLHKHEVDMGEAVGFINLDYILHKCAVLFCNLVLLLFFGRTIECAEITRYIVCGFGICITIVAALVLIGFSKTVNRLACRALEKLPNKEKWVGKKEKGIYQFNMMYQCGQFMKKERGAMLLAFSLQCVKLLVMYGIPFFCLRSTEETALTSIQILVLTGLVNLISSALPNVSGMGSVELAFILVFTHYISEATASSVLVLYRFATYFLPFLVSMIACKYVKRKEYEKNNWDRRRELGEIRR